MAASERNRHAKTTRGCFLLLIVLAGPVRPDEEAGTLRSHDLPQEARGRKGTQLKSDLRSDLSCVPFCSASPFSSPFLLGCPNRPAAFTPWRRTFFVYADLKNVRWPTILLEKARIMPKVKCSRSWSVLLVLVQRPRPAHFHVKRRENGNSR